jgi:prephenate dehydrogenase
MGSFFARYFESRGDAVSRYDIKREVLRGQGVARSAEEAAKDADVVLLATPLRTTAEVCRMVCPKMRLGSMLVEISSVKGDSLTVMRRTAKKCGVRLLSLHPLFGPAQRGFSRMKMAVIVGAETGATKEARNLFPKAKLIPMSADAHDVLMAVMLTLTHLVNIAYAKAVAETISPRSFKEFAPPSSLLQTALAEAVLSQDPSLVWEIATSNRHTTDATRNLAFELLKLNEVIQRGNKRGFATEFKRLARMFSSNETSMRKVYQACDALAAKEREK